RTVPDVPTYLTYPAYLTYPTYLTYLTYPTYLTSPPEHVPDDELHIRTVDRTDLELGEQAAAVFHADERIETAADVRPAVPPVDVGRRSPAEIQAPRMLVEGNGIDEFEIESQRRDVITHADFDVGTEAQLLDQRGRFDMPAEDE